MAAAAEVEPEATAAEEPAVAAASNGGFDLDAIQGAMSGRLAESKGQESASHQIEDATFSVKDDLLEVQTTVSKAMLPMIINADANKILTAVLREMAPSLKLTLLPGTPAAAGAKKASSRPAKAGSVAELAEKHPMVQEARRLFSAEISNVIDLRKD